MATRSMLDVLAGTDTSGVVREDDSTSAPPATVKGEHVELIPYNACDDGQSADFLAWMWKRMQEDELVDYYFPGQSRTGYASFVRLMSGDAQVGLILTDSDSNQWEDRVAGFVSWTTTIFGSTSAAIAGFIFFKKFWDHHTTDDAGRVAFRHWFSKTPAQIVLGVCPSEHAVAIRFNKRVGLREMGRLPRAHLFKGEPCDAILFGMTREDWLMKGDN